MKALGKSLVKSDVLHYPARDAEEGVTTLGDHLLASATFIQVAVSHKNALPIGSSRSPDQVSP